MALTRIRSKNQVTLPDPVRAAAGLKVGDLLDASVVRGGVLLRAKDVVDKVELDRRLDEALEDVAAGRMSKAYKSARALVRDATRRGRERAKNRAVR